MTGIVLLNEGLVKANLRQLNERFGLDLEPLLAMKTRELADVQGPDAVYTAAIGGLFEQLETAREQSSLPEEVPNREALNDFLVRLRLSGVGKGS
jgi:hypothetical protein